MPDPRDLLIEIGTEELPPKALESLADAFAREFGASLTGAELQLPGAALVCHTAAPGAAHHRPRRQAG